MPRRIHRKPDGSRRTQGNHKVSRLMDLQPAQQLTNILLIVITVRIQWYYLVFILALLHYLVMPLIPEIHRAHYIRPYPRDSIGSGGSEGFEEYVGSEGSGSTTGTVTGKRKRETNEDEETTEEHSGKESAGRSLDHLCRHFSKTLKIESEKPADIPDISVPRTSRQRRCLEAKTSRINRYTARWIPRCPPCITSRVYKRYREVHGWRGRKRKYPEGYVEGLVAWASSQPYRTHEPDAYRGATYSTSPSSASARQSFVGEEVEELCERFSFVL